MNTTTNTLNAKGAFSMFVAGLLFGGGLVISGMVNPGKVIGFLDLTGNWDPSLILVMGGGLLVTVPAFHLVLKNPRPLFAHSFFLPTLKHVDKKLILGSILFGLGWGIAGFCPGPAIAALVTLNPTVLMFVAAMVAGMVIHHFLLEN